MRAWIIGRLGGIELWITPAALAGLALLWIGLTVAGLLLLELSPAAAVLSGLAAALLHFVAGLFHHLGHAVAALLSGHPMQAAHFGRLLVLATSVYPEDEPELPGRIHIQRALGGPIASLLLAALAGGVALITPGGLSYWLALFLALDSLLVFTLGVMLPLGFTDMSTILEWRGR